MPRIQILELPMVHAGDDTETPFAVIIDQADEATYKDLTQDHIDADSSEHPLRESLAAQLGARAVLCFTETIEIPANGVYPPEPQTAHVHVEGDLDAVRNEIERMVHSAQHESAL